MAAFHASAYNIGLIGEYGVGKTTIFRWLQQHRSPESVPELSGRSRKQLDKWTHRTPCTATGTHTEVTLWDTGGMERSGLQTMTKSYFIQTEAFILVYDKGNLDTLQQLQMWVTRAKELSSNDCLLFSLWGNCTNNCVNPVLESNVQDYANAFLIPPDLIFEVNAELGTNVDESYQKVLEAIQSLRSEFPERHSLGLTISAQDGATGKKLSACQRC